uniref:DNA_MISMATCH_REPAIR_2 domain-containing protein n=1 Tax=Gongylonema pulchrum TaxID=637853 RepID=A0A183EFT1_9BILA
LDNRLDRSRHTSERSALAGRQRRCFAIREGTDQVIDMLRRGYDELLQDTQERINEVVNELMIRSNLVLLSLLNEIRLLIPCLYHAIEAISIVDFILALATYATKTPSVRTLKSEKIFPVRPSFAQSMSMIVKQGRHPLLDIATGLSVPNDVAGKSTYLKQVCLLQVLAQTGSFVPAEMAAFPILKRIFSRIGHNDDAVSKKSTFALEMSELVPILKSADASSLVVIDELAPSELTFFLF